MTEWKTYKLGDVVNILDNRRIPLSAREREQRHGEYPYYGAQGIIDYVDDYLFDGTYLLIAEDGENLRSKKQNIAQLVSGKYWVNNHAHILESNGLCDIRYICYLLNIIDISGYITGSAQPKLNQANLLAISISLPPLEEQRRIAGILGAIDDKIENNRRINTNLELQAQALYKQWFVECSIVKLGDVVKTTSGGTPSRSHMEFYAGKYGWVKSKELNGSFITNTEESITDDAIAKSAAKLLPAKSILIAMYGATVGQYAVLSHPMTCNQAVCALLPNENYPYTYLFMVAKNIKEELANKAIGSAQQNISQVIIKDIDISSDIEKIKQFHKIVCPHFEVMEKNQKENETLATLRDTLLPKLMNGEIKL